MQINKEFEYDLFSLYPGKPGNGIWLNDIPVNLENVVKADSRVDLMFNGMRAFVVEHILAPLKLLGIEDAVLYGKEKEWDFARPVHRFAYSLNMGTGSIFGPSDGSHCYELLDIIDCLSTTEKHRFSSVSSPISFEAPHIGRINILPAPAGAGMNFSLDTGTRNISATVHVNGRKNDKGLLNKILRSRTPAVCGLDCDESMWHAVGDFTADLCGIGQLTDAIVNAKIGFDYHQLTIGSLLEINSTTLI